MSVIGFLIYAAVIVPPLWMILPRAGLNPYWSLVALIPLGLPALLWYLAFVRWPGDGGAEPPREV